jgi:hypothetical protein
VGVCSHPFTGPFKVTWAQADPLAAAVTGPRNSKWGRGSGYHLAMFG